MSHKPLVLIICTGNSCRSHMAEAFLRAEAGDLVEVQSAGAAPSGYVHPLAEAVMAEAGLDLGNHRSKHVDLFRSRAVDTVITVCGRANEACSDFPGQRRRYHWVFDDPAEATGTEAEQREAFRKVRDEIGRVFRAYAAGLREAQE